MHKCDDNKGYSVTCISQLYHNPTITENSHQIHFKWKISTMFPQRITHFHLVLKLRMSAVIPLLPLHSKMAWIKKLLIFYFPHNILYSHFSFPFDLRNDAFKFNLWQSAINMTIILEN